MAIASSTANINPTSPHSSSPLRTSKNGTLRSKMPSKRMQKLILMSFYQQSSAYRHGHRHPNRSPLNSGHWKNGWIRILDPRPGFRRTCTALRNYRKLPEKSCRTERAELHLNTTFKASSLQLKANVDRDMAMLLGVPVEDVYSTLQAQFGSLQVSQYEAISAACGTSSCNPMHNSGRKPSDIYTPLHAVETKQMIPLSTMVTTNYTAGPSLVPHFNGFPAAQVTGNASPGYSSGDAITAMEETARQVLPANYQFAWSGMALQEKSSGSSSTLAFVFGLLIVFLILAAQYESWSLPVTVLTAVPFGIIGALIATALRGLDNDVYFQIGLLVLVGLAAKNAILIIEFAVELQEKGKSPTDAAVEAGKLRLEADHHDVFGIYLWRFSSFHRHGRRCKCKTFYRYRHHRRNDRSLHSRASLCSAFLLHFRSPF